jgi:hypothetical protein
MSPPKRLCLVRDLDGNEAHVSQEESFVLADIRREYGLNAPQAACDPASVAEAKRALAARIPLTAKGSQSLGLRLPNTTVKRLDDAATAQGVSRNQLANVALEALLEDFELRDAAKIKDPDARARFVASRLARKSRSATAPGGTAYAPLTPEERNELETLRREKRERESKAPAKTPPTKGKR